MLGTVLVTDASLPWLVADERLRPHHFYREHHRTIFEAMVALYDRSEPVDPVTLWAELERRGVEGVDRAKLHALAAVAVPGMDRAYARRIVELADLRRKREAAFGILAGVEARDSERIAKAEELLVAEHKARDTATAEQLADAVFDHVQGGGEQGWSFPWNRITDLTAGGMKRGEVTLIGGWSSHGKSAVLDQVLEHAARRGVKAHLYINEMTKRQRALRFVARKSGVPFKRLSQGRLHGDEEHRRFIAALEDLRRLDIGITDVSGWTAEDIAHDIRRHRWDVAGVDILHLIEHEEERDLARISRAFNRVSKTADCHVLATVHLNEKRVQSAVRPKPTVGDIRGSGMLKNDADIVLFVHREQSKDGTVILPEGRLYLAKVRNGELGGIDVFFRGDRMRFDIDESNKGGHV